MSTPNPTPPTLEERVVALETRAEQYVATTWQKVDSFFHAIIWHIKGISFSAMALGVAALALKLYHQIGL